MAEPLVSDTLWALIAPLLPERPPRPKGGRPPVDDRKALAGILFVLKSGIPWAMLPQEMGCGCGMTCWRRLRDWQAAGGWARLHCVLLPPPGRANVHDSTVLEPVLDAVPPIRQCAGRPRKRPGKLHADKGYDYPRCRRACRRRGIVPRIARRGVEKSGERLGRHRWV